MTGTTLILGANGYLGRHLVARLAADGAGVTGWVRSEAAAGVVAGAGGTPVLGSLDDDRALGEAVDTHDHVVWTAQLMPAHEQEVVRRLLDLMAGSGRTLVMTSGSGVLSERTDGAWSERSFAESDAFVPRGFLVPRVETEDLVRSSDERGVRGVVVRPPAVWGNGGSPLVSEILLSVARTGAACYVGRGLGCYSNVHVEDLVDLYRRALDRAPSGALYHATAGELSFRELARAVAEHHGVPTRSLTPQQAREVWGASSASVIFCASSRTRSPRAREELGWAPTHLDMAEECRHPAYTLQERVVRPSWVGEDR